MRHVSGRLAEAGGFGKAVCGDEDNDDVVSSGRILFGQGRRWRLSMGWGSFCRSSCPMSDAITGCDGECGSPSVACDGVANILLSVRSHRTIVLASRQVSAMTLSQTGSPLIRTS